ncbi:hypothetical protein BaRGS_00013639, partial [Batillaria attramentaria]
MLICSGPIQRSVFIKPSVRRNKRPKKDEKARKTFVFTNRNTHMHVHTQFAGAVLYCFSSSAPAKSERKEGRFLCTELQCLTDKCPTREACTILT